MTDERVAEAVRVVDLQGIAGVEISAPRCRRARRWRRGRDCSARARWRRCRSPTASGRARRRPRARRRCTRDPAIGVAERDVPRRRRVGLVARGALERVRPREARVEAPEIERGILAERERAVAGGRGEPVPAAAEQRTARARRRRSRSPRRSRRSRCRRTSRARRARAADRRRRRRSGRRARAPRRPRSSPTRRPRSPSSRRRRRARRFLRQRAPKRRARREAAVGRRLSVGRAAVDVRVDLGAGLELQLHRRWRGAGDSTRATRTTTEGNDGEGGPDLAILLPGRSTALGRGGTVRAVPSRGPPCGCARAAPPDWRGRDWRRARASRDCRRPRPS